MATLQQPTLQRLIKETRIFLNQQEASNSFWSDEELTMYLNDAVAMYYQEVLERAEGQFDKQVDLDLVSGVDLVALPTDCYEIKCLYKSTGNSFTILSYRNNLTESYENSQTTSSSTYFPSYEFRANNIVLRPAPGFSETAGLRLEYTAFPDTMVWGGDVMTSGVAPVFKELIILYAVYKAKIKESLTIGSGSFAPVQQLLDSAYNRFKDSVGFRSKNPTFVLPFNP